MSALTGLWADMTALQQDLALLALLLAPTLLIALLLLPRYRVGPMAGALLRRYAWTNLLFVALMALSVGLGIALIAQDRALREGTARAADPFDVIVAAPGDRVQVMLSTVYLRPADLPLMDGAALARLQEDPAADLVAPVAFGDSHEGAPVVGTTAAFARHLAGAPAEGRPFAEHGEAVAGALTGLAVGERFSPAHGHGALAEHGAHEGAEIAVVGRLAPTGTPWDRAILVPIETVWEVHGLAPGHPPGEDRIGPPWDPDYTPGTPAVVLTSESLGGAYALRNRHDTGETMAFFPGGVLAELHGLLGDVRELMSLMAILTKVLVAAGVLSGLMALTRLFSRRFALLRALGAPRGFVLAVVWSYAVALIGAGALLGLGLGWAGSIVVAELVTARTDIAVTPGIGLAEAHLVAGFVSLTGLIALLPALAAFRRDIVSDLRQN